MCVHKRFVCDFVHVCNFAVFTLRAFARILFVCACLYVNLDLCLCGLCMLSHICALICLYVSCGYVGIHARMYACMCVKVANKRIRKGGVDDFAAHFEVALR